MATFTVDPATLSALSGGLSGIHAQMQGMKGVATGYEGLLGGSDLDGQVEGFCGHWGYGISQLADQMTKVIQHLDAAAACYGKTEQAISAASGGGGGK
jgi:hypothetical protein